MTLVETFKSVEWGKKRIARAGLYHAMPMSAYHKGDICVGPSVSSSGLRRAARKSLAHFWDESPLNPDAAEPEDKRHYIVGRAMHHLALGEMNFSKHFAAEPEQYQNDMGEVKPWNNNANACKRWHATQRALGRAAIKREDLKDIIGMSRALQREPLIAEHKILQGFVERSAFIRDKATGLWLKVRPDVIPAHSGEYVDLKTTHSVDTRALRESIHNNGYHMQAALIRHVMTALGFPFTEMFFVFVEKRRPYCVRYVRVSDEDLDRGHKENMVALRHIARCLKTGVWPGPGAGNVEEFGLPAWAREQIDRRIQISEQEREHA